MKSRGINPVFAKNVVLPAYREPYFGRFGHQVSFGIAEELLKLSVTYGAEDKYPENWLDGIGTRTEKDLQK